MFARILLIGERDKFGEEMNMVVELLGNFGVKTEVCRDLFHIEGGWSEGRYSLAIIDLDDVPYGGYDPLGNLLDITSAIPSVFMSESGSLERWTRALESGAVSFVTRPLNPETFSRFILKMLTKNPTY